MTKTFSRFTLPLGLALFTACGSDSGSSGFTVGFDSMEIVSGTPSIVEGTSSGAVTVESAISGSGLVRAKTALSSVASGAHFQLAAEIDKDGYLDFLAFGDSSLGSSTGLRIRFACDAAGALSVTISGQGGSENTALGEKFLALTGTDCDFAVAFDIHNDETPAHIVAWASTESSPSSTNAGFNSEDDATFADTIKGTDANWGLGLSNATVTVARTTTAKFAE